MKTTQKKEIRKYLEAHGKLTAMAALNFWGCWNLKARISELRLFENMGIGKKWVKTESGKRGAEYYLI